MSGDETPPWAVYLLLWRPKRVQAHLAEVARADLLPEVPNLWQLGLGVARLWHRVVFRNETVGTCADQSVRATWRARALQHKALRLPCLLAERAVAPLDFSGLGSDVPGLVRHLIGAHHDQQQAVYDLQILACHPGGLDALAQALDPLLEQPEGARARWLADLTVFEDYHAHLKTLLDQVMAGETPLSADEAADPDISFVAHLRWCAQQPATPAATLRALASGQLDLGPARVSLEAA